MLYTRASLDSTLLTGPDAATPLDPRVTPEDCYASQWDPEVQADIERRRRDGH